MSEHVTQIEELESVRKIDSMESIEQQTGGQMLTGLVENVGEFPLGTFTNKEGSDNSVFGFEDHLADPVMVERNALIGAPADEASSQTSEQREQMEYYTDRMAEIYLDSALFGMGWMMANRFSNDVKKIISAQ